MDHHQTIEMLDELELIAKRATPGKWTMLHDEKINDCTCAQVWSVDLDHPVAFCRTNSMGKGFTEEQEMANAKYIATLYPERVISLIQLVRTALAAFRHAAMPESDE